MPDEIIFHSEPPGGPRPERAPFLSSSACAVAGLALAVTALLGQSGLTLGISQLFGPQLDSPDSARGYYLSLGVANLVQPIIAVLLAGRALRAAERWEANLARATVLVAAVAALGGAATVLGTLLHDGTSTF